MNLGKLLLVIGGVLAVAGAVILITGKLPFLGRLPGDLYFKKGNVTFFFPVTTSILISAVVSLIFWMVKK